jgi:hypothetical protein
MVNETRLTTAVGEFQLCATDVQPEKHNSAMDEHNPLKVNYPSIHTSFCNDTDCTRSPETDVLNGRMIGSDRANIYIYYEFVRQGTKQQKCTSTNIDKSKSDMHDQRDLEIQLIMSLISSMVKQSGERERDTERERAVSTSLGIDLFQSNGQFVK